MHEPQPNHHLSEISHLFLSGLRQKHAGDRPRPQRRPPGQHAAPQMMADEPLHRDEPEPPHHPDEPTDAAPGEQFGAAVAIVSPQLEQGQIDHACAYAAHLAGQGRQVAMVVVRNATLSLWCFSRDAGESGEPTNVNGPQFADALRELNVDVDQWLFVTAIPASADARARLLAFDRWTVLTGCTHADVVDAYRSLKLISDIGRPRLTLAILDSQDAADAQRVGDKLAGCSRQFLGWPVDATTVVESADDVTRYCVMESRADSEESAWDLLAPFLPAIDHDPLPHDVIASAVENDPFGSTAPAMPPAPIRLPERPTAQPQPVAARAPVAVAMESDDSTGEEVIELPAGASTEPADLLSAILKHDAQSLECPVRPPMATDARLALTRDGRLTLLAVVEEGLGDLSRIGKAFAWLNENRGLIGMAVPQLRVNTQLEPTLRLIVDYADVRAETLQPMLQSGSVKVETYRRLKWGQRVGVLLEAA